MKTSGDNGLQPGPQNLTPAAANWGERDRRSARPTATATATTTATARGKGGWTADTAPYRLDCLAGQDPVAGWLVDDTAVAAVPPAPAAG